MKNPPSQTRGFTLIEVVFALAIAVVSIVSILSILRVAINSDGESDRDTTIVAMTNNVMTNLRSMPFDALWAADPASNRDASTATSATAEESRFYFTQEGSPIAESEKGQFDAQYVCIVTKKPDVASKSAMDGRFNRLQLDLNFRWPINQENAVNTLNQKTVYASIARY